MSIGYGDGSSVEGGVETDTGKLLPDGSKQNLLDLS